MKAKDYGNMVFSLFYFRNNYISFNDTVEIKDKGGTRYDNN